MAEKARSDVAEEGELNRDAVCANFAHTAEYEKLPRKFAGRVDACVTSRKATIKHSVLLQCAGKNLLDDGIFESHRDKEGKRKMHVAKTRNKAPVSPLRYPGAKRWMSGYISRSIAHNNLFPELFVEPFAGGASVALAQLHSGLVDKVALNDRDPLVSAFWKTLFFDTDWLVDKVWKTDISIEIWDQLRKQNPTTTRGQAFKCLFLNRTSFSGVLAPNAGPIGGKTQKSKYKIDCRFTKETVIRRIQQTARYKKQVAFVWNLDWKVALGRIQNMQRRGSLPKTSLFYLDPPFYKKASSLYRFHFNQHAHLALRDFLAIFDDPWILSYDSCPEVIMLYKDAGFRASNVNLIYTVSRKSARGIGKELILSNLPRMVSELQLGVGKKAANPARIAELAKDPVTQPGITQKTEKREASLWKP